MSTDPDTGAPPTAPDPGSTWKGLARGGAIVIAVMTMVIQVLAGEVIPPLIVFGAVYVVALILLSRRERAGAWMLLVLSVLFLALNAPFIFPHLAHPETAADFGPSLIMAVVPLVTLIGVVGVLRTLAAGRAPRMIGVAAGVAVIAGIVVSGVMSSGVEKASAESGDIAVDAVDANFVPSEIEGTGGTIALHITNADPIRHTFTIDELDVNVELPGNSAQRVEVAAAPGTYPFYCTIAGHEAMKGTLVVE